MEGEYDYESWLEAVRGLENEPEKGKRCEVCFDKRFDVSAKKALELGEKKVTTTLLVSPLKSQEQLKASGKAFYEKHGVEFIFVDYRAGGGTQDQSRVTKEEQLYRQDYCGCIYGLTMQREQQNRLMDEMFSPISNQTLPSSIEQRLELYRERDRLEDKSINYKIIKQKFLNYRQLNFQLIKGKKEVIPAYALSYSYLKRKKAQGKIEFKDENIYYFNKDEIVFITLSCYNEILKLHYKSVKELLFHSPSFELEQTLRVSIMGDLFNLSPIIVVETIPLETKLTISLDSKIYDDVKSKLIKL